MSEKLRKNGSFSYDDGKLSSNDASEITSGTGRLKGLRFLHAIFLCIIGLHFIQYYGPTLVARQSWSLNFGYSSMKAVGTVRWFDCGTPSAPGIDCGTIIVPLDYLNQSNRTSTLALARYKATQFPKRGTVFLNPGGPGGSGVSLAMNTGPDLAQLIGPYYDLVGFDPRGIGKTTPKVQCFPNPVHRQYFVSNTVFEQGFTVSSNLSDPRTREHLVEQYRQFLALKKTQAELCAENMGEDLKYMGTATVARDIDFMTTVMDGEDALINYWGASYGTILGAYLVNMFPDRVGKVAIDGVANPVLWAAKPSQYWHRDWISSAEDTFKIFLEKCSEVGPESCPLSKYEKEDPGQIGHRIDKFLDELSDQSLPVPNARRPGFLTAGGVRALLLIFMEVPKLWPMGSRYLADAMKGDGTEVLNMLLPKYVSYPAPDLSSSADLARLAVTCLDSPPPASSSEFPTPEELSDIGLSTIREVSRHFGMSVSISEPDGGCQFWPVKGPERFTGPWNHTLKNPILIVSNTADPVTPIVSGHLVSSLLSNSSRLLIQNSPGHCSLALLSLCTVKAYRAFYINGTLPPNEFVCEVDESPFPKAGLATSTGVIGLSEDDDRLMASAKEVGKWMMSERVSSMLGHDPFIAF